MTASSAGPGSANVERWTALAAFVAALGLVALLALIFRVSGRDLAEAVLGLPLWLYAAVGAVQAALIVAAARKWHLLLCATSSDLPTVSLADATVATALGTLAGQVLPLQLVTPTVRAWSARRHDIPVSRAAGTSVFEQLFDVVVLLSMGVIGLMASVVGMAWAPMLAGAVLVALTLLLRPVLGLGADALAQGGRRGLPGLSRLAQGARQARDLPGGLLARLVGLSILRYGLLVCLNVMVLACLVPGVPLLPLVLAFPLIQAVSAMPLVPGGLGVTEATWVSILMASGIPAPEAAGAALGLRIVSTAGFLLVFPLLLASGPWSARWAS